ncbi:MAG TPA: bacteriohopanetetrol glucosamine biosynthesis glycosyltransferase HpnI [Blastocatellia bacterium]|nr:bacteriohopanetetrol glucosamine biosynthesis glycosyltransferase HpnI [Blastocatellia bacterium]
MKTFLLLAMLIVFSSLGEILSARGMKQIGEVSFRPRLLLRTIPRLFTNGNLIAGVACLAFSFFSFLSLLSYADLSYVVPLTAVGYITNTIGAKFLLHERISKARWWGTLLVTLGVAIISLPANFEAFAIQAATNFGQQLLLWLNPTNNAFTPAFSLLFAVRAALLLSVVAALVYYVLALVAGWLWRQDRRRQRALGLNFTPPVSILIPVRGADVEAYQNFASFCQQDYLEFQLVFGCRDEHDPAVPIIRKLQSDFPQRQIDLVISANEIGANAKVSNLNNMLAHAAHEHLIVVDSDIRVTPDYLRRVIAPMQLAHVGMVTCLYRGAQARTFAALLENIGIAATFGPEVLSSRALEGIKFALGSTVVTRREILEKIGGFPGVADYLADDFLLGNLTAAAGYEVVLSDYVVDHIAAPDTIKTMLEHQLRWARAVRISRPKGYAGLVLTHGLATSLLLLLALGFTAVGWTLVALTFLLRFVTALWAGVVLMQDRVLLRYLWLVPIRDLIGFGVWLVSFGGNEIRWRGHRFVVRRSGKIEPIT